jgi:UDP-N-acetylmuramate--alanine ligase
VPFYGSAVLCLDDPPLQDILSRVQRRVITYGLSPNADLSARDVALGPGGASYTAVRGGDALGRVELRVPGVHNVLNSLAAVAVGLDLDVPFEKGVDRRFQQRGDKGGVLVIDDYGHHPTEIRATLEALRTVAGARRCVVLFQPHRYTRTLHLWDEFCRCFLQADVLFLTDVYAAGEDPVEKVNAQALAEAIESRGHRHVRYAGDLKAAVDALAAEVRPGDIVLTLGAGNVWTAGEELLRRRSA